MSGESLPACGHPAVRWDCSECREEIWREVRKERTQLNVDLSEADVRYFCTYCCGYVAKGDNWHPCADLYLVRADRPKCQPIAENSNKPVNIP